MSLTTTTSENGKKPKKNGAKNPSPKPPSRAKIVDQVDTKRLIKALQAFELGDYSVADTVSARQLLSALRSYEAGNFSVRLPEDKVGIAGEIASVFNKTVARHERILKEFSRINRFVGKEGKLSERAEVSSLPAGWEQHVISFNHIIDALYQPITEISEVIDAIDNGNLTLPMPLDFEGRALKGEYLKLAKTVNAMIGKLKLFTDEVIRVAREVGNDGILGGRAEVKDVSGVWKELTDTVNTMADNLTIQVRSIAEVTTSVAKGDLTKSITIDAKGEVYELKNTINTMVGQLSNFAREVSRVAKEVGTEGVLGVQARVEGVSGQWRDLTDNVNTMASNLTNQVREITRVSTAVAKGDLTEKIAIDAKGEVLQLKNTINTMVDQLSVFAEEVTRVAREVGTEGVLGGQAQVRGVAGTWRDLTETVNTMASNLTNQVRDITQVTTAVADGDLTKKITVEVRGEILELKNTINSMVDRLGSFAGEVTRVAQEVGTEGKLGGLARVEGVTGIWRDLTENVNGMANNLTDQVRNIADVATSVAKGDLTKKITVEARGEILELKNTVNTMVDQLGMFSDEVTRVATEVGSDGTLGTQAEVRGVTGTWRDLTESVNKMASNLTNQVRNIAEVATAVAQGDLSKKITVDAKGEILDLKDTVNTMVDQLNAFSNEVTRVAAEVGTEGKLGGQAEVGGVAGIWAELTENVNKMANNLTEQVRDIAKVTTAVAQGDLSQKITVDVKGEINDLKNTINTMVDQLNAFSSEVTRVARDVGTEGKLGGTAKVEDVAGVWKDLTDNVNLMATNLTNQVRDIAKVTTAVAQGDLSKLITVDVKGEINDLKGTINNMVNQLNSFSGEVTRVAREVGTEGQLGGQAKVMGVSGVWKDLTDNVNLMASNLTNQVRDIARVTKAVAEGNLGQKIAVEVKGEINDLKNTINTMVDQLSVFAEEVTRVAKQVGTDGRLGGQASVEGVAGVWKNLTDNVNQMASNLTAQVRDIAQVTTAVAQGDLSKKISVEVKGEINDLKNTINIMVDQLSVFAEQVTRVAREVGTEGKLGGQARVEGVSGTWKDLTDNVNLMASNLTDQVRDIAKVTTAVAEGDLTKKISVEVQGEINDLKNTINRMVDQLNSFSGQVTSLAREVGTEGKLGGQALVEGVSGTWKDLTANVNTMATNLTNQVRNVSEVATAIANGDLTKEITVEVSGEMADLKNTINSMVETLSTFADQVTNVAREVGVEGMLGGKADVPGARGTWRNLTDNVNELAGNLTRQVRAIGEVVNSVTQGDLSGSIEVEAKGEVETLKNNINTMIGSLADTTSITKQQDWLKTNLTDFANQMQGKRSLEVLAQTLISNLCKLLNSQHGVFYLMDKTRDPAVLKLVSGYGYKERKGLCNQFGIGEGIVGQCAFEKSRILISDVPSDYIRVNSGLGDAIPVSITVLPVLFEDEVMAVIELAAFRNFTDIELTFLDQLSASVGVVISSITANTRTEELLKESQSLTKELQSQQEELRDSNQKLEQQADTLKTSEQKLQAKQDELHRTNEELERKAKALAAQKTEIEGKNREVEQAKIDVEEKVDQLALTSKYKSQFLANMSHELRTPLNSLLILSKLLSDNKEGNLTGPQSESLQAIHASGEELLSLINEVLDLSKIEAGMMNIHTAPISIAQLQGWAKQTFTQMATGKGLDFKVDNRLASDFKVETDFMRIQQVIKNLLSNAIKFTEKGSVTFTIKTVRSGWNRTHSILSQARSVVAFQVEDSGIGISKDKFELIFEAFQQADGTTSRKFGGTGLGLSISREISNLLGGEITVQSTPGKGSIFTLYLPSEFIETRKETKEQAVAAKSDVSVNASQVVTGRIEDEQLLMQGTVEDDRDSLRPSDRWVLIVDDDSNYAKKTLDEARKMNFKGVVTPKADVGFAWVKQVHPTAIILNINLPGVNGWAFLDRLKHNLETRHIPIYVFANKNDVQHCLHAGAKEVTQRPADSKDLAKLFKSIDVFLNKPLKQLLVVDDNETQQRSILELIGNGDVQCTAVGTAKQALAAVKKTSFDCIVLDLLLPDMSGFKLLEKVKSSKNSLNIPVIVYTGKELSQAETTRLSGFAESIVIKDARSPERLLSETSLFLHRKGRSLPESKRLMIENDHQHDPVLENRKALIVDDDFRNIFALSSILEAHSMDVIHAENGIEALKLIKEQQHSVDIVLMDIMMPEMDGYETIRAIRKQDGFEDLPILAVTAKAMKGDQEKCFEAGASDYITKPLDTEHLLSLLRVMLYQKRGATSAAAHV